MYTDLYSHILISSFKNEENEKSCTSSLQDVTNISNSVVTKLIALL